MVEASRTQLMKKYVVKTRVAPDRRIVREEYVHDTKEAALDHCRLLEKQGWKADVWLREEES